MRRLWARDSAQWGSKGAGARSRSGAPTSPSLISAYSPVKWATPQSPKAWHTVGAHKCCPYIQLGTSFPVGPPKLIPGAQDFPLEKRTFLPATVSCTGRFGALPVSPPGIPMERGLPGGRHRGGCGQQPGWCGRLCGQHGSDGHPEGHVAAAALVPTP